MYYFGNFYLSSIIAGDHSARLCQNLYGCFAKKVVE